jgi:hypothetical protein
MSSPQEVIEQLKSEGYSAEAIALVVQDLGLAPLEAPPSQPKGLGSQHAGIAAVQAMAPPQGRDSRGGILNPKPTITDSVLTAAEREAQAKVLAGVDSSAPGASALDRFLGGLSPKDEGRLNLMIKRYGEGNVETIRDEETGEVTNFVFTKSDGTKALYDPDGPQRGILAKLGEFGKDVIEHTAPVVRGAVGTLAALGGGALGGLVSGPGALVTGALAGGAADAATGIAQNEIFERASGVPSGMTRDEIESGAVSDAVIGAGVGVAGPALGTLSRGARGATRAISRQPKLAENILSQPRIVRSLGQQALDEPVPTTLQHVRTGKAPTVREGLERGTQLEADTGVGLTAAQLTRSQSLARVENSLRSHAKVAREWAIEDADRLAKAHYFKERVVDSALKGKTRAEASRIVASATRGFRDLALADAKKKGGAMFEVAIRESADRPAIAASKLLLEIDDVAAKYGRSIGETAKDQKSVTALRDRLLKKSQGKSQLLTVRDIQETLEELGEAVAGNAKLTTLDPVADQQVAKRLFSAMLDDLDTTIAARRESSPGVKALKDARTMYRNLMETVETDTSGLIAKILNTDSAEAAATGIARGSIAPAEIARASTILRNTDPESAQLFRGLVLDEITKKATGTGKAIKDAGIEAGENFLSPQAILKVQDTRGKEIAALFGDDLGARKAWRDLVDLSSRLSDSEKNLTSFASKASKETIAKPQFDTLLGWAGKDADALRAIPKAVLAALDGRQTILDIRTMMSPKLLTHVLTVPEARNRMLKIAHTPIGDIAALRQVPRLMAEIKALSVRQQKQDTSPHDPTTEETP